MGEGGNSRIQSWNEIVDSMVARLSKWKMKTLSIGWELTRVLMSAIRDRADLHSSIKSICGEMNNCWFKEKDGLLVFSSYCVELSSLMFKWIWRFTIRNSSLWARVIKAIHGDDGKIGNGVNTYFWEDVRRENVAFKYRYPRLYALELDKSIDVAAKLAHSSMAYSFRRTPRGGVEQSQMADMLSMIEGVSLVSMNDRWVLSLEGSGDFSVASVRKLIDDRRLSDVSSKTRWIKAMHIKVYVHAWKVRLDCLPTRLNISRRGMDIDSILCSICGNAVESSRYLFFDCHVVKEIF
ncbi:RNA-directed DNA polymerase, eukaryota, reverse transcriptase zinc-binding domain protein [Tanacetum coccineum]